ncbi:MerR family transcriptional regulator [Candidatus Gastranaerophilus sp. (ex Termes propinquus)]|nr:MerR family transcriptional regulator [Candidatus Gastranaerophilus sp. (ex Termes propinquus)]
MSDKVFFTINDFAKFSRTTRDTLLHYDKIGLLSPVSRGDNNYRYYSSGQLAVINVIRTLQDLGMTLNEIKNLKDKRTPELTNEVLSRQIEHIDAKIDEWVCARRLLTTLTKTIHSVLNIDEEKITVESLPAEVIILGDLNNYNKGRDDYDNLLSFYKDIGKKYPDLNLNYPVWAIFSEERIKRGDWVWPDRYYFNNPEGQNLRPAGLYAIGYIRGGYGQSGGLYKRMIDYINSNGLEICGDTYEEYPLNEVSVVDSSNYLIRVMITVREKKASL